MPLHLTPLGARPAGAALVRRRRRGRDQRHDLPRLRQPAAAPDARALLPRLGRPDARRCRRERAGGGRMRRDARARMAGAGADDARAGQARPGGGARPPGARPGAADRPRSPPRSACRCAIEEFVGAWSAIPPRLQTRLGGAHAGARPRRGARPARLRAAEPHRGPRRPAGARRLSRLPARRRRGSRRCGGRCCTALGETLDVDFRPVLRRDEVPAARLGAARLGRTAWLAPRARPATPTTCGCAPSSASPPKARGRRHDACSSPSCRRPARSRCGRCGSTRASW